MRSIHPVIRRQEYAENEPERDYRSTEKKPDHLSEFELEALKLDSMIVQIFKLLFGQ